MKKRAVFFGTPDFARSHLEALLKCDEYDVVGVVSQPDRPAGRKMHLQPSPVKLLAVESGVPVIAPQRIKESEALLQVQKWNPDVCVVVAYGQIFPQSFLDAFPQRVVNVHGSLLPRWRGAAPIQRALMAGDTETGVCLQVMVSELDAGDVIGERSLPLTDGMDAIQLHEAMKPLGAELLRNDLLEFLSGHRKARPQDPLRVTYAKKIDKLEAVVDWTLPAKQIYNNFRGLVLGPGSKTFHKGKSLKITKLTIGDPVAVGAPGAIVVAQTDFVEVQTGEGTIRITELQPESRQRMPVSEFLKGYSLKKGDRFGE